MDSQNVPWIPREHGLSSGKGTSCPLQPPPCTYRDTEANGKEQMLMATWLGPHSPGSSDPPTACVDL